MPNAVIKPKAATEVRQLAKQAIAIEAQAVAALAERIDASFESACDILLHTHGRIIVMGVGKSGHIAKKIAATFASTGSPSFYIHPAEASHGDTGMITRQDAVVLVSHSGETPELLLLLPVLTHLAVPTITLTGDKNSTLAKYAKVNLDVAVEREACPLGLAPTSSTTAALAMGDALAICLLELRGFTAEDFAFAHPGGSLGRKLLRVQDLMVQGEKLPQVKLHTPMGDVLWEMSNKGLGMTTVVDDAHRLLGIFTDGDLRRALDKGLNLQTAYIEELMHTQPKFVAPDLLAGQALKLMETFKITSLVVLDKERHVCGIIHIHHLLHAGVRV